MSGARVLLVVPTLGRRPDMLLQNLASIRSQSIPVDITLVGPVGDPGVREAAGQFEAALIPDPGSLTAAINAGVASAKTNHEFVNWLGDDDLLEPGSISATLRALDADPKAVVAFGACKYIDEEGRELWVSRAGKWALRILAWGPDLIPQPGMLIRASAWRKVGGLDETYRFAFDLDLLLRLKKIGTFVPVEQVVASFRWHGDSLTVNDRTTNLIESERARRSALPGPLKQVAWVWEKPVQAATRFAAHEVSRRARRISASA